MSKMNVTPEMLRATKAQMENHIAEANALVQQYLATHQGRDGRHLAGPGRHGPR